MDAELSAVLAHLQNALGERNFTMWIEPIAWSRKDDVVCLTVPSQFHREWISRHLLKTIEGVLNRVLGSQSNVRLVVDVGSAAPEGTAEKAIHREKLQIRPPTPSLRVGRLVDGYDFESFIVGPTNELAARAGHAVAQEPGRRFNPLFIWGGVGLGKTHLVNAIGHECVRSGRNRRVACLSAETFTNMMIQALRADKMAQFRDRFRELDVLILDDVQFLAGKERTQEEFFHTFEWLVAAQKQVVLTCDRHPSAVTRLECRLRSRFESGLIADMQPPTEEMRAQILRRKAEQRGIQLPDSVVEAILARCGKSVREIEGGLNRVAAFVEMMQRPLSVELVDQLLGPVRIEPVRRSVSVSSIQQIVAEHFGITVHDLVGHSRDKRVSQARQVAMYLCRSLAHMSLSRIAAEFGGRDHTSVLYAIRTAERRRAEDSSWSSIVAALEQRLVPQERETAASRRP